MVLLSRKFLPAQGLEYYLESLTFASTAERRGFLLNKAEYKFIAKGTILAASM